MSGRVVIESDYEQKLVKWNGAAESEEIEMTPGRTYSFYVDGDFAGSQLQIESWIEYRDLPADAPAGKGEGRWIKRKVFGSDFTKAIAANTIEYVDAEVFSGISKIRLVSDVAETATGLVMINT